MTKVSMKKCLTIFMRAIAGGGNVGTSIDYSRTSDVGAEVSVVSVQTALQIILKKDESGEEGCYWKCLVLRHQV